jgi:hypothetical protein
MTQVMNIEQIIYSPDEDARRILESLTPEERNRFINEAVKSFRTSVPDSSSRVQTQLKRLFGTSDQITADESTGVCILQRTSTQQKIQCKTDDVLDVLKSLRQPISDDEVWDLLCCFQ